MSLLVYTVDHSLYCAKLRILMQHKRLDWREVPPPGGGGSPEYLALVPSGNIPALVDGDLILTDSEAIAEYLEEKYPDRPMLSDDLRGRAWSRERSRFHDTRLEPALRLTFPHVDPDARSAEAINHAVEQMNKYLRAFALILARQNLPEGQLWMGDCGTIVTLEWMEMMQSVVFPKLLWPSEVSTYQSRVKTFDAVATVLTAYRPAMEHYLRAKNAI